MKRFVAAGLTIMAASGCGGPEQADAALRRQYPNITGVERGVRAPRNAEGYCDWNALSPKYRVDQRTETVQLIARDERTCIGSFYYFHIPKQDQGRPTPDWRTISAVRSDTTVVVVPLSDSELEEAMRQIQDELEKANPNAHPLNSTSGSIGRDSAWEIVEHSPGVATRYTFARKDGRWRIVDSSRVK